GCPREPETLRRPPAGPRGAAPLGGGDQWAAAVQSRAERGGGVDVSPLRGALRILLGGEESRTLTQRS
ncbi:unnamed protein product, partial [Lampetra fluviatilis]